MSIRLPVVFFAMLATVPSAALAQDVAPRIAVVDVQRVLAESRPGRERTASMEAERERLQAEGNRLQEQAIRIRSRLADLEGSQAESELASLRQELEQKTAELNRFAEQAQRDLKKKQETVLREIEQIVMPVIQALGDEGRFLLISRKFDGGWLYVAPHLDVTDEVIARVDARPAGAP